VFADDKSVHVMAKPILPTPPLKGKDARDVLKALERGVSDEVMEKRVAASRERLANVFGVVTGGVRDAKRSR
jgi:hypothetical protein